MAFSKTIDPTKPVGTVTTVNQLDTFLQDLQVALIERINSIGGVTTDWNLATDPLKWEKLRLNNANTAKILIGAVELLVRDTADATTLLQVLPSGDVVIPLQLKVTGTVAASLRHTTGQATTHYFDAGNKSGSATIDFANGTQQKVTLTGNVTSLTLSNPLAGGNYILFIKQDATGSRTVTWPASVKWSGGVAPTLTTTASRTDIVHLLYDGTNYYGTAVGFNYNI
jgi:hypothetical protein